MIRLLLHFQFIFFAAAHVDIFNPDNAPIELDEADVGTTATVCVSIVTSIPGTASGTLMILGQDADGG